MVNYVFGRQKINTATVLLHISEFQ